MNAPITGLYAGLLAILIVLLVIPIIKNRRGLKVGLGDGGHRTMQQAVRAHGNAVEYIPIFLLLLFLFELNGGSKMFLHIAGATFLLARIFHAIGLHQSAGTSIGRVIGTLGSLLIVIALAVANIWRFVASI
jgi:uncharacterized protein